MKIYYGISNRSINVTNICLEKLKKDNIICIPSGDSTRAYYFTDPLVGVNKKIIIQHDNAITEYDEYSKIIINILTNEIHTTKVNEVNNKIKNIHSKLKINHGSFSDELPEQKMAVRYLTGNEKVLEIGGNIGRNTLVIASILKNNNNFVTLESNTHIAKQLIENRNLNNFHFHIEPSALSLRNLIQKDWETIPSDTLKEGYTKVNTISLKNLHNKYNINFDTLIIDCEGAFYYILTDMPEILDNINLIIMENDYHDISNKIYIDNVLLHKNFTLDYVEGGGWGPCYNNFYEVWIR